jgi:endoglucanase
MVAGHIDEIGLMVSHIDEGGLLCVQEVGGWDIQQLVGQRVRVVGHGGELVGVIGRNAIHLLRKDATKAIEVKDLWIDVGATEREDLKGLVRIGDFVVLEQPWTRLLGSRISSKALDNRLGAFLALETCAMAVDSSCQRVAIATVQEEIGGIGARSAAFSLAPDVAIVIDGTHATDTPGVDKRQAGERGLGSGPELSVGSYVHHGLLENLIQVATAGAVPFTLGANPRRTGTDADFLAGSRGGIPTVVVSPPIRYMHSPNEVADLKDVEATADLVLAFLNQLDEEALRHLTA